MDEWLSEGVQVGGVASAMGVLGLWTGAQHERMDPLGAYRRRSHCGSSKPSTDAHVQDRVGHGKSAESGLALSMGVDLWSPLLFAVRRCLCCRFRDFQFSSVSCLLLGCCR